MIAKIFDAVVCQIRDARGWTRCGARFGRIHLAIKRRIVKNQTQFRRAADKGFVFIAKCSLKYRTARVFYFKVFGNSRTWISKRVIGNHESTILSHLASFINLCAIMALHISWRGARSITGTSNVASHINFDVTTVEYGIDVDKCAVWTRQVGCHKIAGCGISIKTWSIASCRASLWS